MEFFEVLRRRRTTNGPFLPDPVRPEHQRMLVEAAAMAPSHFNSQPWRFVLVEDRATIEEIARISGESMRRLMEEGTFWKRYRPYFRFSEEEMERRRDGILIDQMPKALKPFRRQIFSEAGQSLMNRLGVPRILGEDNRRLVAGSPLLLAVLLDRAEYRPGELSGFYSVFGMGAAVENIWLATVELGMGIQFVSTPMEIPENWRRIERLLEVPEELALMAVYRLGYVPGETRRPTIDWQSRQRKRLSQYVFRNTCRSPERDDLGAAGEGG
ncbi:cob(II)yrinic acid a,c-diamide reductase [Rubrobacter xylanophilus DSM 9941]|uniref:Cob(II)yrinic acid a,c-diamide reductase n=1 Tax=Rubrobacter xylanophilus (strain DSM 9941 / JCM 11954 / NBRC 16129 / PRD-1) TaxID=266117 RepID=Q1AX29_RUBXD|nr:nitroreductase family protein [Rubrobacter xylanophilus]ABG04049.1 cob(II)yrinic acid a,c-diamide reductase [Rubrobacter xylanophilus DSM 9941]